MGLKLNALNENLFIKAIKLEERGTDNGLTKVRKMISEIKNSKTESIEKTWRLLLEGALYEGRLGNKLEARSLFNYLLKNCKS